MKKIYAKPQTTVIEVKTESLLVNYSNAEASSSAVTLSRGGDSSFFDDDDED